MYWEFGSLTKYLGRLTFILGKLDFEYLNVGCTCVTKPGIYVNNVGVVPQVALNDDPS